MIDASLSNNDHWWKSPKRRLGILRTLTLPLAAMAIFSYPFMLLGGIMASDSGTDTAIHWATLLLFGFTFYVASLALVCAKWNDLPMVSTVLLGLVTVAHIVALFIVPSLTAIVALVPLSSLGISPGYEFRMLIGNALFVPFAILVPALSTYFLARHALELDMEFQPRPVELWDLKRINK